MNLRAVILIVSLATVFAKKFCSYNEVLNVHKRGTYDFAVQLLDRVSQDTDAHFVFSPISTWIQLITLARGARGSTQKEILKITRYHRNRCYQRKYRQIINRMYKELKYVTKRSNVIAINHLLDIKQSFVNETLKNKDTKILMLNFKEVEEATDKVNEVVQANMDGIIKDLIDEEDFEYTIFVMADTAYFKSDWLWPFNPAYTSRQTFYSEIGNAIGEVEMMKSVGYYKLTDVPFIQAKVLEIPFKPHMLSMLVFLPKKGSIRDIYYKMKEIRLSTISSLLKRVGPRLITVKIPRIKISTAEKNIPELVYDMGVKRIFYPDLANLTGITNSKIHVSSMSQAVDVEITEMGARAIIAEYLTSKGASDVEFVANRPFAFLIVDWKTEIILFAGIYSNPSIY
ncbi:serine protease inhibitor 77Ba-like [Zerene cesonia]|uniref:serine protease inhibitor 77Ba-like n=1 Tax=Zerene cesonia TaxID=33412 RepID=UPI0018E51CA8|nr:serine protease inhibitor 77Ba-like [Zerene cesonia]